MGREVTVEWIEQWKTRLEDKRRRELLLGVEGAFLDLANGFLTLTEAAQQQAADERAIDEKRKRSAFMDGDPLGLDDS